MANRKRNIQVKFYVTAEEKELMEQKMAQLQTKRIGAYLRKMAIDGYIIYVDTRDIKPAGFIKDGLHGKLVMLKKQVLLGGSVVGIFRVDMLECCQPRHLLS